jgi:hypothetical protein
MDGGKLYLKHLGGNSSSEFHEASFSLLASFDDICKDYQANWQN